MRANSVFRCINDIVSKTEMRTVTMGLQSSDSYQYTTMTRNILQYGPKRYSYSIWTPSATICLAEHCFRNDPGRSLRSCLCCQPMEHGNHELEGSSSLHDLEPNNSVFCRTEQRQLPFSGEIGEGMREDGEIWQGC